MIDFILLFTISFLASMYVLPHSIRKLSEQNYLVQDMYKKEKYLVPTNMGTILFFISYLSIAFIPLMVRLLNNFTTGSEFNDLSQQHFAFILVVSIYAVYGLIDDLVDIGRKLKLSLPILFGYPLVSVVSPDSIWIPLIGENSLSSAIFLDFTWNDLFRITVVPIYVMVVANLVNMHSGYNGLQSGLSIIIIFTIIAKSILDSQFEIILPSGAFLGAFLAFWFYNRYPSRAFEGNVGAFLFGSVIGSMIVLLDYWWFGFFILIPHIFNFLLWIYWVYLFRKYPDDYLDDDGNHTKFGTIDNQGCIIPPNRLTLKWIPNYYYKINEPKSVSIMYSITFIFCLLGLLLFQ